MKLLKFTLFSVLFSGIALLGQYAPETTVLALDLHDVLCKKDKVKMTKESARLIFTNFTMAKKLAAFGWNRSDANGKKISIDGYFQGLLDRGEITQKDFNDAVSVFAAYRLDPKLMCALSKIDNRIKMVVYTNAGPATIDYISKQNPEFKTAFSGVRYADEKNGLPLKNNPEAAVQLEKLITEVNPDVENVIVVDDSPEKLAIVEETLGNGKANFNVVTFKYDNPEQFEKFVEENF